MLKIGNLHSLRTSRHQFRLYIDYQGALYTRWNQSGPHEEPEEAVWGRVCGSESAGPVEYFAS